MVTNFEESNEGWNDLIGKRKPLWGQSLTPGQNGVANDEALTLEYVQHSSSLRRVKTLLRDSFAEPQGE